MSKFNIRNEYLITNMIFMLCFFPTTIFFLLPYETQPLYAIFCIYLICIKIRLDDKLKISILFFLVVLLYVILSVITYDENIFNILINGFSYFCPILLYLSIYNRMGYLSYKVYIFSLLIWLIVGLIQTYDFFSLLKPFLLEIGKLAFSDRFLVNPTNDGRGAFFLASEPSISAPTIILFIGTGLFFYFKDKNLIKTFTALMACIFMVYLNKSATLGVDLLAMLLGLLIYLFIISKKYRWVVVVISLAVLFLLINISIYYSEDSRLFLSIYKIIDAFDSDRSILDIALELGSARVLPLLLGYMSIIDNYGLGHGIASWAIPGSRELVQDAIGINIHDFSYYGYSASTIPYGDIVKPQSFFSLISYDMGIFGLIVTTIIILVFIGKSNRLSCSYKSYIFIFPAIVWLLLFGLVTLPMPWVMFAYANYFRRTN
ncbi:hypothetical protein [Polynucleobacter sp. MG-6-Vaara-E2]|uniref:hypothetical protein n=1 Tax=Polynucleobacter sp. MG-6-Vaara-E2 TaxID=2576932 RepID=UPI001BFDF5BC|nr:hypothetical protein [Polynucleobacter sp. MG-6-Vaara-E2]QWD96920.1 hypothetical protein ICV38_01755 [Polynucleobacter sp. MG-6-Vaara-E2]